MSEITKAQTLEEALHALNQVFIGRIPGTLASMESDWGKCKLRDEYHESWQSLHRHLHNLAGSSGSFGFPELGDRSRVLEHAMDALFDNGVVLSEPKMQEFHEFMVWVKAQFIQ